MAIQMLYQQEMGESTLEQIFDSFDLSDYVEETDERTTGAESDEVRNRRRQQAAASFEYARRLVEGAQVHGESIDSLIRRHAENWRLERMPVIDRNILRLALYEMLHEEKVPKVVIVDEAIELAKKFGSENSSRFVNGLLDGVLKSEMVANARSGAR
ncbi:MAG: transcription antitermination factor NusB [Thermoanaerobaculia bacterium]|nr:transcription antitermination factor NusB [Thermoanaerobaculia bacterium]